MPPLKIAITACATTEYMYAMTAQARRIQSAVQPFWNDEIYFIMAGDNRKKMEELGRLYKKLIPNIHIELEVIKPSGGSKENYKPNAQLLIAQLRTAVCSMARSLDVDYCWSLDSDVLPSPDSLEASIMTLKLFNGHYSIAACPYPSQGGGGFLCGRGTIYQPILPDWYESERIIPDEIKNEKERLKKEMDELMSNHRKGVEQGKGDHKKFISEQERIGKALQEIDEKIRECPPKGNVFHNNSIEWRRRGWYDQAYPAIGRGSIVPTDWCGYGCTLMNKRALSLSLFDGYDGKGTEDLYIVWHRWFQAGLHIACIPHCPADHVIRNGGKEGYVHMQAYHETEGECVGHLRIRSRAFYSQDSGEPYIESNDGVFVPKQASTKK